MSVLSLTGFFGEEDRAALRVLLKTALRYAVILVGLVAAILFAGAPEFVWVYLGAVFGTDGVWAAFPAGRILLLVSLYTMAAFNARRLWPRFDDNLFLPVDFDPAEREKLVLSLASKDELKTAEEAVYRYCLSCGVDQASAEAAAKISGAAAAHISAKGFKFLERLLNHFELYVKMNINIQHRAAGTRTCAKGG